MKKVIFICLLSLSTCLTKPNPPEAPGKPEDDTHPNTAVKPTETATSPTPTPTQVAIVTSANDTTVKNETTNSPKPTDNNTKATTDANHAEKAAGNDDKNKEDQSKGDKNVTPTKPASPTPTPIDKGNKTAPADHEKKVTSTAKPDTPTKSTEAPAPSKPTDAPSKEDSKIVQARGFDGASFIGGIILTLGLLAIGFMGFKYYKNQTERNYHTL